MRLSSILLALFAIFSALPVAAQTFSGSNLGAIPDGDSSVDIERYGAPRDVQFAVSGTSGTVSTVRVSFRAAHTYVGDLRVSLIAPNGKAHVLFARTGATTSGGAGASGNLVSTNTYAFDDSFSTNWWSAANVLGDIGSVNARTVVPGGAGVTAPPPVTSLNQSFLGHPANGTWILRFEDRAAADVGSVAAASLTLGMTGTTRMVTSDSNSGVGSLRQAILDAGPGDLITFDAAAFARPTTIAISTALPDIDHDLAILGPGADLLTLARVTSAADFRLLHIVSGSAHVSVSGLTITGGRTTGFGGGIRTVGPLTLSSMHITGNFAGNGGGVNFTDTGGTIVNSTIAGNASQFQAGGVRFQGAAGQSLRIVSSTIHGNRSASLPGGIHHLVRGAASTLEMVGCTVTGNVADSGVGGILTSAVEAGATATTLIANSIIAENVPGNFASESLNGAANGAGQTVSLGFNLSDAWGELALQSTDRTGDPRLGPLGMHGGGTPSLMPLAGSAALDAGNSSGSAVDQRGVTRPRDLGGVANAADAADIGAVEVNGLVVTNAADSGAGSLREAINAANANGAGIDDILFDAAFFATPRTILLTTALPDINSGLTLNGPGAHLLDVRRSEGSPAFRILDVQGGLPIVSVDGLTVSNGDAGAEFGAGGINSNSTLSLNASRVRDSVSSTPGAGVFVSDANAWLTRCTIDGNRSTASNGGGVAFYGSGGYRMEIDTCTLSGNFAAGSGGGLLVASFSGIATASIRSSTFANNTSTQGSSGAIQVDAVGAGSFAFATPRNSLFASNLPGNFGIGLFSGATFSDIDARGFNLSDRNDADILRLSSDQNNANAALGPLALNGGTIPTHAIGPLSDARDGGTSDGAHLLIDQRSGPYRRPFDDPAIANAIDGDGTDIGAFELRPDSLFANGFEG